MHACLALKDAYGVGLVRNKGVRGPGHLFSEADWMPGTASAPVSLGHHADEVKILQKAP